MEKLISRLISGPVPSARDRRPERGQSEARGGGTAGVGGGGGGGGDRARGMGDGRSSGTRSLPRPPRPAEVTWAARFLSRSPYYLDAPGSAIHRSPHTAIHHGLVLISDGKSPGKPARLELTKDALTVQVPLALPGAGELEEIGDAMRRVTLRRQKDGGLGLSVKGGNDLHTNFRVPVLISKIFKDQAADRSGALYVGDAIVEVNGLSVESKNHDEVVKILRDAGDEVRLGVRHCVAMAPYLRSGGSLRRDQSGSAMERLSEAGTWRGPGPGSDFDSASLGEWSVRSDGAPGINYRSWYSIAMEHYRFLAD